MHQKRPFYIPLVAENRKELIIVFPEFFVSKKKGSGCKSLLFCI